MPSVTAVDLIVLAVLALSACIGALRGLVRELLSIAIWVAAILGAFRYGSALADWLDLSGRLGGVAGFAIIFVAVFVAGAWAKKLLARLVAAAGLGGVDRFLGFLFGAIRGVLICFVALIAVRPFAVGQDWWWDSQFRQLLELAEAELQDWVLNPGQLPEQVPAPEQGGDGQRVPPAAGDTEGQEAGAGPNGGGREAPPEDPGGILL